ncbi:MAG: hypothetical protein HXY50_03450 [Ignavibacteriaceae bacterium]|nr:hypothetical protein [Ignavibacteriaceae bacterium]
MEKHKILNHSRILLVLLYITIIVLLSGCYSFRVADSSDPSTTKIYKIEKIDSEIIDFCETELGYALLSTEEVVCFLQNGEQKTYPRAKIKKMYTEKFDFAQTLF